MALLIVGLYAVGLSVDLFDKPLRPPIVNLHAIFGLVAADLGHSARRAADHPPQAGLSGEHGTMFERAAAAGHGVLYLLMIAVPLIGLPTFLWRGRPLDFGLFQIPSPFEANRDVAHQFGEVHELLAQP